MHPTKRQILRWSVFLTASTLLIGCAGNLKEVRVSKTLPGQQKKVHASIVKNYDTVQSRALSYHIDNGPEQSAPDQAITAVGSNDRTYNFAVPNSGALQPGQALDFTWTITFNRGGTQSRQKSFVVPGVPDLAFPIPAFEFRVNNQVLPGNPGSSNQDQQPAVQVSQPFTALVKVRNNESTVMNESFVVRVNIYNLETNNSEQLEKTIHAVPQDQEVLAAVTYQSDSPARLIFSASVDDGNEIPETNEINNDTGLAQYRIRVVN